MKHRIAAILVVFEGVNDIGGASGPTVATNLVNAFAQFVDMAHAAGIKAYGVPITPFGGSNCDSDGGHHRPRAVRASVTAEDRLWQPPGKILLVRQKPDVAPS